MTRKADLERLNRRIESIEDDEEDGEPIELTENQRENLAALYEIPIEEVPDTVAIGRPPELSKEEKEELAEFYDADPMGSE